MIVTIPPGQLRPHDHLHVVDADTHALVWDGVLAARADGAVVVVALVGDRDGAVVLPAACTVEVERRTP